MSKGVKIIVSFLVILLLISFIIFFFSRRSNNVNTKENSKKSDKDIINNVDIDKTEEENDTTKESEEDSAENDDSLTEDVNVGDTGVNDLDNKYVEIKDFDFTVNKTKLTIGSTAYITTSIYPGNATNQEVSYSSSNKNVAIVSKNGMITGVNVGECYISVSVGNLPNKEIKIKVLSSSDVIQK